MYTQPVQLQPQWLGATCSPGAVDGGSQEPKRCHYIEIAASVDMLDSRISGHGRSSPACGPSRCRTRPPATSCSKEPICRTPSEWKVRDQALADEARRFLQHTSWPVHRSIVRKPASRTVKHVLRSRSDSLRCVAEFETGVRLDRKQPSGGLRRRPGKIRLLQRVPADRCKFREPDLAP